MGAAGKLFKLFKKNGVRERFTKIFQENLFEGQESVSGRGSDLTQTRVIRQQLPELVAEFGVKHFIDAPCGDFFWMKEVNLPVQRYTGIDIVEGLIEANQRKYANAHINFACLNIITDKLPVADIIFCRDCLVHLNYEQAFKAIRNFHRSKTTYLLTTTFSDRTQNVDLGEKDMCRTLNLQLPPFNFPKPIRVINENCTEGDGNFADKSLGLWKLADLSIH